MVKKRVLVAWLFALFSSLLVVLPEIEIGHDFIEEIIDYGISDMDFYDLGGGFSAIGMLLIFIGVILKFQCVLPEKSKRNSLPQISSVLVFIGFIFVILFVVASLIVGSETLESNLAGYSVAEDYAVFVIMNLIVWAFSFSLMACLVFILSFGKSEKTDFGMEIKKLWFIPALIMFVFSILDFAISKNYNTLIIIIALAKLSGVCGKYAFMLLFVGLLFSVSYTEKTTVQNSVEKVIPLQVPSVRPVISSVSPQVKPPVTPPVRPQVQPDEKARRISEAIKYYKDLCDTGAITQEEYERIKTQLLNSKV